ncbi:uncharacterized protein LOC134253375 [Saccostrea cucullata]|uniref:uncharacterized protein LOC134253375 n=1 Tax=Saccostrea cuccullata TaxID=36930 RepID=UPI002ED03B51
MLSYLSLSLLLFYCVSAGQKKHWLCVKTPPPRFRDLNTSCPAEQCYSLHLFACYNEDCCALNIQPEGNTSIPIFGRGINLAKVTDIQINEASGLAASRLHPGVLYTHNDSGDRARIFAVDSEGGGTLAVYDIPSAAHHDWEDMAVGVCPSGSGSCIYIGDVGGNYGDAGSVKNIYVVEEPDVISGNDTLPLLAKLHYNWDVYDTETLMVDPTGDLLKNGREVVLRTHHKIYYWMVNNRKYLTTLNTTEPWEVPQKTEPQGEAVCWDTRKKEFL